MIPWTRCALIVWLLCVPASGSVSAGAGEQAELFPLARPFDSGFLKVSNLHTIQYALFGNPAGKPVFVLHGGPGFGCYPRLTQYFNPKKFFIVLHDQRGAGRSRPLGEVRENTTWDLVEDIERLRMHLEIEGKIMVFGGSWGTTLGLAYAETHPERVSCMVLRGIFTGTRAEIDNLWRAETTRLFFPDAVARLEEALPPDGKALSPETMVPLFNSEDKAVAKRVLEAWARYSVQLCKLYTPEEALEQPFGGMDLLPCSRIDGHYMLNRCFFEEGQLLRHADKLADIPVTIINGRYDMVCPPVTAYRLHRRLPKSRLIIVEQAGHSESEAGILQEILKAVAAFED